MSTDIEFKGEIYTTDEHVIETPEGAVFLPAIKGEFIGSDPSQIAAIVNHPYAACMNALDSIEPYKLDNGRFAVFADGKEDADLAADFVGMGATLEAALGDLMEQVNIDRPDQCVCKSPAEDPRFK